jgi:hypothetical protein
VQALCGTSVSLFSPLCGVCRCKVVKSRAQFGAGLLLFVVTRKETRFVVCNVDFK